MGSNGEEIIENNVDIQNRMNHRIRRHLVQQYNNGQRTKLRTTIIQRTGGVIMRHGKLSDTSEGNITYLLDTAAKLIPEKLTLGVVQTIKMDDGKIDPTPEQRQASLLIGKGVHAGLQMKLANISAARFNSMAGSPVIFIPLPDGTYMPEPLKSPQFKDRQG